ncbi:hypothetical protein [Streptomyces chryseus]
MQPTPEQIDRTRRAQLRERRAAATLAGAQYEHTLATQALAHAVNAMLQPQSTPEPCAIIHVNGPVTTADVDTIRRAVRDLRYGA